MGKNSVWVEWTFPADEQAWPSLPPDRSESASTQFPPTGHPAERRLAALIVALVLLLAGVWEWHRRLESAASVAQLQAAVAAEAAAAPAADRPSRPTVQLLDQQFIRGDLVMAQVTVRDSTDDSTGDTLAYRETRFYRRTSAGWQRTEPDPAWLGPSQTLETAYFTIRYRAVDAAAVAAVAPRLDRLYEKLRRDFGLPVAGSRPDIVVEVFTDEQRHRFDYVNRTLAVPSPAVHVVPVEITAATFIYQPIVHPLAALVMAEVAKQHPMPLKGNRLYWSPLLVALPLWAVWDDDGPLAVRQADVVRWLYHNAQATSPAARQTVPAGYDQLCRVYRVWGLWPMEMFIPLACAKELDQPPMGRYPTLVLRLDGLLHDPANSAYESRYNASSYQVVAMATVADYVVATYGRDRLARWLAALGDHTNWESLVPAVFGVSAAEFEAGWRTYLQEQYR